MASAADGDEEAVQLPVADDHMTESSMMLKQTAVKKAAADDQENVPEDDEAAEEGPIHRGDFSLSSFACICWLAQLMAKGPRKGAKVESGSKGCAGPCRGHSGRDARHLLEGRSQRRSCGRAGRGVRPVSRKGVRPGGSENLQEAGEGFGGGGLENSAG